MGDKIRSIMSNMTILDTLWFILGMTISLIFCTLWRTHHVTTRDHSASVLLSLKTSGTGSELPHDQQSLMTGSQNLQQVDTERNDIRKAVMSCQEKRQTRLKSRCQEIYPNLDQKLAGYYGPALNKMVGILLDPDIKLLVKTLPWTAENIWIKAILSRFHNYTGVPGKVTRKTIGRHLKILSENYSMFDSVNMLENCFSILTISHPFVRIERAFTENILSKWDRRLRVSERVMRMRKRRRRKRGSNEALNSEGLHQSKKPGIEDLFEKFLLEDVLFGENKSLPPLEEAYPCIVPYKFITKAETTSIDLAYIMSTYFNKTHPIQELETHTLSEQYLQQNHSPIHLQFFSQLNNTVVLKRVTDLYRVDMQLFGYTLSNTTMAVAATCEEYDPVLKICC